VNESKVKTSVILRASRVDANPFDVARMEKLTSRALREREAALPQDEQARALARRALVLDHIVRIEEMQKCHKVFMVRPCLLFCFALCFSVRWFMVVITKNTGENR